MPTNKFNLDTPCLVIDKTKLIQNLKTMQEEVAAAGKKSRPHCKTHKCTELAKLQIQYGAAGLCATKVTEALGLAKAGLKDILITSPVVTPIKIQHLIESATLDENLMVVCDSFENAKQLNQAAKQLLKPLAVLVDVDPKPGIARTGVSYQQAIELGRFIHLECEDLSLKGLQCYAGNLQHIKNYSERSESSLTAMEKAAKVKQAFLKADLPCDILSGSGTGTYDIDMQLAEVTEVQPGSYAVMDMEYTEIGSKADCDRYEKFIPAMTMLVTVISANHSTHVTVDAGSK
jgi:D-serine deaminase-like pyridoxal phosphate-dependent protein